MLACPSEEHLNQRLGKVDRSRDTPQPPVDLCDARALLLAGLLDPDVIAGPNGSGKTTLFERVIAPATHLPFVNVPEEKIRSRFGRLWVYVAEAIGVVQTAVVHDNSSASRPLRKVASFRNGRSIGAGHWPSWTPSALRAT